MTATAGGERERGGSRTILILVGIWFGLVCRSVGDGRWVGAV